MTIPSTTRKAGPLLGNSSNTAFAFTFKVFAESDIRVVTVDSLGVETELVLNTDYSVALNGNQETSPGGTVTYPISGSALPTGSALAIVGALEYDQPLDLPDGGNFSPASLENQLDRTVMQIQQLDEVLGRALLAPVTSAASGQLPAPEANTLIGWNSAEDALQNVPIDDIVTVQSYGSFTNDPFTGDGLTTTFALSSDPITISNLMVIVDGLVLTPGTDFTLASGSLIFTVAPSNGAEIIARYGQALVTAGSAAVDVSFSPTGDIAATNVQAALAELDTDKLAKNGGTMTADPVTGLGVATKQYVDVRTEATRINVASSGTVNLTSSAPNTRHINITGTTTITGFTVAAGLVYFVRFNASLTLTNGAGLVTQTGANIVTQAGDTCILRATAANTVELLSYVPSVLNQQTTRSMVRVNTPNGNGSTNTAINRFTNIVTNQGTDITYADSAANGGSFTINTAGVYAISASLVKGAANGYVGVSLNSTQLTTAIESLSNASEVLAFAYQAGTYSTSLSWTGYLAAGSVIRSHGTTQALSASPISHFTIVRVS